MKTWWVAPAVGVLLILGLVLWGVVPQCVQPERKPGAVESDPLDD